MSKNIVIFLITLCLLSFAYPNFDIAKKIITKSENSFEKNIFNIIIDSKENGNELLVFSQRYGYIVSISDNDTIFTTTHYIDSCKVTNNYIECIEIPKGGSNSYYEDFVLYKTEREKIKEVFRINICEKISFGIFGSYERIKERNIKKFSADSLIFYIEEKLKFIEKKEFFPIKYDFTFNYVLKHTKELDGFFMHFGKFKRDIVMKNIQFRKGEIFGINIDYDNISNPILKLKTSENEIEMNLTEFIMIYDKGNIVIDFEQ